MGHGDGQKQRSLPPFPVVVHVKWSGKEAIVLTEDVLALYASCADRYLTCPLLRAGGQCGSPIGKQTFAAFDKQDAPAKECVWIMYMRAGRQPGLSHCAHPFAAAGGGAAVCCIQQASPVLTLTYKCPPSYANTCVHEWCERCWQPVWAPSTWVGGSHVLIWATQADKHDIGTGGKRVGKGCTEQPARSM
eukprot:1141360-Pelagomonas_calceolata.AAC.3